MNAGCSATVRPGVLAKPFATMLKALLLMAVSCTPLATWAIGPVRHAEAQPESKVIASVARPAVEILPFRWFYSDDAQLLSEPHMVDALRSGDPLRATELAYRLFLLGHERKELRPAAFMRGMQLLDHLISDYQPAERTKDHRLLKYRNPTDKLAAGWWSAMDGFLFPLVLQDAATLTGVQRYRDAATRVMRAISRDVAAGGSVHRDAVTGCWLSEYSWRGMSEADEYYVLNGHLYGLHALYLYAQHSADAAVHDLLKCALKGTDARVAKFRRAGLDWVYYMLRPPTINQAHYTIFEKMQFDAQYQ